MQSKPDPPYKYICYVVNHFMKFYSFFPLINKCAKEVSKGIVEKVLCIFGVPTILHSNSRKEFVNDIIIKLLFLSGQVNTIL